MLRHYYATDVPPEYTAHVPGAGFNLNVYFLREAQRRGLADPAIIKELYKTYEWRLLKLARQDVGPAPPSYSTLPERNLYYWRYIDEHYGAEFEEIRTELLAVAGDYSWPYYRLAMVESEHCNNEAAWELIRRGNRAPLNQVTHCFPFNEIIGQFWDGQPLTDRITGGMAYQEVVYPWLTDPVRTKDMVIRLTADAREREDLAALGELHLYCCRFGSMERASLLQGLNGLVMAKNIVLDAAQNQWPVPHTAEQRQALARLHKKFLNINQTCRALSHQTGVPPGPAVPTSRARQWIDKWANVLGGRLGVAVEYYGWLHDDGLIEYHGMCSQIAPLFAEAEQFDYATLSWPDE